VSDAECIRFAVQSFNFMAAGDDGTLTMRPGASLDDHRGELKAKLSCSDEEAGSVDDSDLGESLLTLVKRKLGRSKQQALAAMVQMGLQRIVVDEGRIHASMDLRVDAQSASQEDKAERSDWRVNAAASGGFGVGPWSASASASTSIGKVQSDHQ